MQQILVLNDFQKNVVLGIFDLDCSKFEIYTYSFFFLSKLHQQTQKIFFSNAALIDPCFFNKFAGIWARTCQTPPIFTSLQESLIGDEFIVNINRGSSQEELIMSSLSIDAQVHFLPVGLILCFWRPSQSGQLKKAKIKRKLEFKK